MKNKIGYWVFILAALFLLPQGAQSADGDSCNLTTVYQEPGKNPGQFLHQCFEVCDTKDEDDATCTEFDITLAGADPRPGYTEKSMFEISLVVGCTDTYSVDLNHGMKSGGTEHNLVVLNAGTRAFIVGPDTTLFRFVNTDIDDATNDGCTDLTVLYHTWTRKF